MIHSRLIPICNAFYSTGPPSFSLPVKKYVTEQQNVEMKSQRLEQSPCLETQSQLKNRLLPSAKYDAKNSKTLPVFSDNDLLWIYIIIQIVMPLFRWFLEISFDSDIQRARNGETLQAKLDCCTFIQVGIVGLD